MTLFSQGVELVRQWLPSTNFGTPVHTRNHAPFLMDLDGTLGLVRAADDRIDASLAIRIRSGVQDGLGAELRVEAKRRSVAALADSNPFVWLQIVDDRGAPLAHERFLGNGVGTEFRFHVQINVPAVVEPRKRIRLSTGVHARVVTRTYGNLSGVQYHVEQFMFVLMPLGAELPGTARERGKGLGEAA